MNRKESLVVGIVLLSTFIGGAFAASSPAIQQVFVTNFPKDPNGNLKVAVQNPQPVNVTVQQTLPSRQIVLFNGNETGFGYSVNQTVQFSGLAGSAFNLTRIYSGTQSATLSQSFKIFVGAPTQISFSLTNEQTGQIYNGGTFTANPIFIPFGIGICCFLVPGLNTIVYTFTLQSSGQGSIQALDTPGQRLLIGTIDATGYRRLTIHASCQSCIGYGQNLIIQPSIYDSFTQQTFDLQVGTNCGPSLAIPCIEMSPPTMDLSPPFVIQVRLQGAGDMLGLKIVTYLWN